MSKSISYYDWEQSFKRKEGVETIPIKEKKKVNHSRISSNIYKNFINEWKKKNLP